MLSHNRAIAEVETFLLDPESSWGNDPPNIIANREFQKNCSLRGLSQAKTRSVITTPASEDFSGVRFLCSPQVIPLKNGGIHDGRHQTYLLMADLEGVF